ncbi:MAG: PAS domain-containing protein, partial [Williamsia sp.]|nr:PAS domain-containing protein [Williamsia sp.]
MKVFDEKEEHRLAALDSYQVLDTLSEKDFDDLTQLASLICDTPIALITLVDRNRQWFKSRKGLTISETERAHSFCAHAIDKPDEIMIVEDVHEDSRFKDNPLVTGEPFISFYAGVPLVTDDGFALGSLCFIDNTKRKLTEEQEDALKTISRQVMDKFNLRRSKRKLEELSQTLQSIETARQATDEDLLSANDELKATLDKLEESEKELEASYAKLAVSEQQMRIAAESANFGMWGLNLQTGELFVSDNMKVLYGFPVTEVMTLEKYFNVSPPEDRERLAKIVEGAAEGGKRVLAEFPINDHTTGELKWMRAVGKAHLDKDGKPWRLIGMTADITEQINAPQEISRLNADLQST